ncbi:MAG: mechanosensitive ion channel family protein [Vampirovibrionales bacterium]|nr:mechanosensitive ion channel family protein [Vampirovibrionales bacterium]
MDFWPNTLISPITTSAVKVFPQAFPWLTVAILALLLWTGLGQLTLWATRRLEGAPGKYSKTNPNHPWRYFLARLLRQTHTLTLLLVALDIALLLTPLIQLHLPLPWRKALKLVLGVIVLLQAGFWGRSIWFFSLQQYINSKTEPKDRVMLKTLEGPAAFVGQILVWTVVLLGILQLFGINIATLVTGLGIGGIAVALAVQNILGDLFAAFAIAVDKPFVVGDSIAVGTFEGTVEHIGLKTTRLKSINGEQLVFANSDLLGSRVKNYRPLKERRHVMLVLIDYETPQDLLVHIPGWMQAVVEAVPQCRFERAFLKKLGEYGLEYELVFFVTSPEFIDFTHCQQAVNLGILAALHTNNVELAHPAPTASRAAVAASVSD